MSDESEAEALLRAWQHCEDTLASLEGDPTDDDARERCIAILSQMSDGLSDFAAKMTARGQDDHAKAADAAANETWRRMVAETGQYAPANDPASGFWRRRMATQKPDDGRSPLSPSEAAKLLYSRRGK